MSERDPQSPESEPGAASEPAIPERGPEASGQAAAEEPVPRLPRGRGLRLSGPEIVRILMFIGMLVGVLALRQPCADGVASFVGQFDPDAGVAVEPSEPEPGPSGQADKEYIRITGEMSEQEIMEKLGQAGVEMPDAGSPNPADPAEDEPTDTAPAE